MNDMKKKEKCGRSRETTFGEWLLLASFAGVKLEKYDTRPAYVGNTSTPPTLDELTIGQLIELGSLDDQNKSLYEICKIVLGLDYSKTKKARAIDVVHFCGWVWNEVDKINKLFESTRVPPTQKEIQAGIKELRFGLFGLVDWYARRMGIQDHDAVLQTPWMRIYKCLDMDNKTKQFEKRYMENETNEYRRKIKGNR